MTTKTSDSCIYCGTVTVVESGPRWLCVTCRSKWAAYEESGPWSHRERLRTLLAPFTDDELHAELARRETP